MESEKTVYELFKWSVILKGLISLAEVVVGLGILLIPRDALVSLVQGVGTYFSGYVDNALLLKVLSELQHFGSATAIFVAFYLLSRGLIKCFLVWALLKNLLWAYPSSLLVLGVLLLYQFYEIITKGSIFVIAITLFDLVVMYFIWREWRIVAKNKVAK